MAGGECKKRLRYCKPQRIWRRHHGRFGDGRVFDQYAFELEWADPIVGRFEDVIGASDIGQITVLIHCGDVAGAIDRLFGGSGGDSTALLPLIAFMSPVGRGCSVKQISPSLTGAPSKSRSATRYPGKGRPIEPALTFCPGLLPTKAVVSVCP